MLPFLGANFLYAVAAQVIKIPVPKKCKKVAQVSYTFRVGGSDPLCVCVCVYYGPYNVIKICYFHVVGTIN